MGSSGAFRAISAPKSRDYKVYYWGSTWASAGCDKERGAANSTAKSKLWRERKVAGSGLAQERRRGRMGRIKRPGWPGLLWGDGLADWIKEACGTKKAARG